MKTRRTPPADDTTTTVGPTFVTTTDQTGARSGDHTQSTLAAALSAACEAQVVHADDFASWDEPVTWWHRLEEQVLGPLAAGETARYQGHDWVSGECTEWHEVPAGGVLILEGVSSARAAVSGRVSLTIWVDAPPAIRLRRGLERDGEQARQRWEQWMAVEDRHFALDRTRGRADIVVDGTRPFLGVADGWATTPSN